MKLGKKSEILYKSFVRYYFIFVIFCSLFFVVLFSGYRIFLAKPQYLYVRAVIRQDLWWAPATKPNSWIIANIRKGFETEDAIGLPVAKIMSIRNYPSPYGTKNDVFMILRLNVSYNQRLKKYIFNRSAIDVGSPIDFQSSIIAFTAIVTEISEKPINDKYVKKTIFLDNRNVDISEYNRIRVGDYYFDGEENIFEILSSKITKNGGSPVKGDVLIKARIKGRIVDGDFVFGENQIIRVNKKADFITNSTTLKNYKVTSFE